MTLQEAFEVLRYRYKSHLGATEALVFSATQYRAIRNGRANLNKKHRVLIMAKAMESEEQVHSCPAA